jgi:predicted nucleic acid-binding protein
MPTHELLDANIVVRYLVADGTDLVARATALIESTQQLYIPAVILAEVGFVLTRVYKIDRVRVVDAMLDLMGRCNIEPYDISKDRAIEALRLCAPSARVSFTDAMLWATARTNGCKVWTFDKRFPAEGIAVSEP